MVHTLYTDTYEQHSGDQGPTIQYMRGSDVRDIVIERLVWNGKESRRSSKSLTPIKLVHINRPDDSDTNDKVVDESNDTTSTRDEDDIDDDDLKLDLSDITATLRGNELDKINVQKEIQFFVIVTSLKITFYFRINFRILYDKTYEGGTIIDCERSSFHTRQGKNMQGYSSIENQV